MSSTAFTRYYRPPEIVLDRENINEAADVWSIGCILSELFQKAFNSEGQNSVLFEGDSMYPISPKDSPGHTNN